MKKFFKVVGALVLCSLVALAAFAMPTLWGKPWLYDHFTLRVLMTEFLESPQLRAKLGVSIPFTSADALDDLSPEAYEKGLSRFDDAIEMQAQYQRPSGGVERLSYDVFGVFLGDLRAAEGLGSYTISHIDGPHVALPDFMVQFHKVTDAATAKTYLSRMARVPIALEQAVAFARYRANAGFVAPTFILDSIVRDARAFSAKPAAENALVLEFKRKLVDGNVAGAGAFETQAAELVEQKLYPAFEAYARDIEALRERSTDEPGLWKFKGGDALYRAKLKQMTTTKLSPDEIHAIGVETLAKLEAEARPLLDQLGVEYESIGVGLRKLSSDPRFTFPDTHEGKQQVLTYARELVARADALSAPHFGVRPDSGVEVDRVPVFKEKTAPFANYNPPAIDGSRGGVFFVNLRDVSKLGRHSLPTLICHEAIPGHHFQIAIAQKLTELPFFRRLIPFNAYAEGWGLYAERLCDELGFFETPEAKLGYLDAQMFRAARLVVDTGLHHGKWSRAQAVAFMTEHTGIPPSDVEAEVDRYTMWPGQACGYMIGQLKMIEIRERAEQSLGDSFDAKAFHDRILTLGSVPLDLLEREMDAWMEAAR